MPTVLAQLDAAFRTALLAALGVDADPALSVSQTDKFGDYQSNCAMAVAKRLTDAGTKTNPRQVAERVRAELDLGPMASETSIAGPGFINVRLSPTWLSTQVAAVAADPRLGVPPVDHPRTVVVDYSGPNVAKQMHVGHLRSTIIGDAISRVLAFQGQTVIRQNHIGDWGTQFGMLIGLLKRTGTGADADIADLDGFYKEARRQFDADPAVAEDARATVVALQAGGDRELALWRQIVAVSQAHYQPIYDRLGVQLTPADARGESFYNPMLATTVADLTAAGVATPSEGAVVVFTEGSAAPLIVEKTGGGYGYATTDMAAVRYRVGTLHADRVVYVVGSPQSQHFRQVFAAARRAGWAADVVLEHAAFGSVLGEDGKMFKSRDGGTVKLIDLMDEAEQRAFAVVTGRSPELPEDQRRAIAKAVGLGAMKYADLSKDRIGDYTFSFDAMLALEGNTAVYLLYAYARVQSIFRRAAERGVTVARPFAAAVSLAEPHELAVAKHVLRFGDVLDLVARELKPHHLCTYLYELATRFSGFFENCPVLQSDGPARDSRLTLCEATGRTMAAGLDLLGIEHPDQM